MQLFWFECRLILRHKLYIIYIFSFLLLFCITVHPFSLGKNFAPMDERHLLIHMLLEDSEKDEIQNEHLIEKLEKLVVAHAYASHMEEREELQKKISFIEEHSNLILSGEQKTFLVNQANEVVKNIGNGIYSKDALLQMDTAMFQKLEIELSDADLYQLLDEVNERLGGWTHYAANGLDAGESFRKACLETRMYHGDLHHEYYKDGSSRPLSLDETLAKYEREAVQSGYTGMFVPYLLDKLGLILSLTTAFVLAVFQLSHQGYSKDVIAIKAGTAAKYMGTKGAGMVFMAFVPCLISLLFLDIRLCIQGITFGYQVDPYVMLAGAIFILLPELLFLISLGMLSVVVLDSAVAPFLLETIFFGISVDDFYGSYGLSRIVIRFPFIANSDLLMLFWEEMIFNRLLISLFSAGIFTVLVLAYHLQKYGKAFWGLYWLQSRKEKLYLWKKNWKRELEIKRIQRMEENDFSGRCILYYFFQLGYWKGIIYCAVLNIVSVCVFYGDMSSEQICMRFLPLHAILIFSSIGFAEEEGNCNDLLAIKNQIHIRLLQFLFSSILTIISVFGSGMIFFSCEMGTMANVLLFSMILGSIDTMVKQRFGAAVGTFTAVGIYIFAAVSL